MMVASVQSLLASLTLADTPLAYRPAKGPGVPLTFIYSHQEAYQPEVFHYSHLGPKWTYTGISYIVDDPQKPGHNVQRYMAGGGTRLFKGKDYDAATGAFAPDPRDMSVLKRAPGSPPRYERRLANGGLEIYAHPDGKGAFPRRLFLTEARDNAGNALKYQYDGKNRLVALLDASGKKTTLEYQHPDPLKVTGIQDPAGRRAQIAYDAQGRLISITDAVGIVSKVSYRGDGNFITRLETPYGATKFAMGEDAHSRWVDVTDPLGHTERVESRWNEAPIAERETNVPKGFEADNQGLNSANTFYWDAVAYAQHKGDYTKAQLIHWRVEDGLAINVPASAKAPLESRVWYAYPEQDGAGTMMSCALPMTAARVLPDGSTQTVRTERNAWGKPLAYADPAGRQTQFEYAANGIDLVRARQKTAAGHDTLTEIAWNGQHRPIKVKSAGGQVTQYAWNAAGQLTQVTDPLARKIRYQYDEAGALKQTLNPLGRAQAQYAWDAAGNLARVTDSSGDARQYEYDALNRLTKATYPDNTTLEVTWDKLDPVQVKGRNGKRTRYKYDAVRRLVAVDEGGVRTLLYGYDAVGRLVSLTDGRGQLTKWEYDLQGRLMAKNTPDGAKTAYEYDSAGRPSARTDMLGQKRLFAYGADGRLASVSYPNALVATPEVRLTWDTYYPRLVSVSEASGTTRYRYAPTGQPGALRPVGIEAPNSAIAYQYDAVGRIQSRNVDDVMDQYAFDPLSRVTERRNSVLGEFRYGYREDSRQVMRVALAGTPVGHSYTYGGATDDRRVQAIHNPPAARSFGFEGSAEHLIAAITESTQDTNRTWRYGYDALGRLQSAQRNDGQQYHYTMDAADNLIGISTPEGANAYRHDAGNKIKGHRFDANGNTIEDGRHRYTWDAENRLVKIAYKKNPKKGTEFKYDGQSRRVAIIETDGAKRAETKYTWCGDVICQARDAQNKPTAYYFNEGAFRPGTGERRYYAKEHLGSIRDVLDEKGQPKARYDYDPYGNLTSDPDKKPEFGYAGMHYHAPSGLYLTKYRAYDPQSGRWLSRDPIGEAGGINLYAYVGGNPVSYIDPLGLRIDVVSLNNSAYDNCISAAQNLAQLENMTQSQLDQWVKNNPITLAHTTSVSSQHQSDYDAAIAYLGNSDTAKELIEELQNAKDENGNDIIYTIIINNRRVSGYVPKTGLLFWDPHFGVRCVHNSYDSNGNLISRTPSNEGQSPALGLIHEMDHARYYDNGVFNMQDPNYGNGEEYQVIVGTENTVARELNTKLGAREANRTNHDGDPVIVSGPTVVPSFTPALP
jgi:RHS repeat-associated protein